MDQDSKEWLKSTGKNALIMFAVMAVASIIGLLLIHFI